jgi:hypothetical protein
VIRVLVFGASHLYGFGFLISNLPDVLERGLDSRSPLKTCGDKLRGNDGILKYQDCAHLKERLRLESISIENFDEKFTAQRHRPMRVQVLPWFIMVYFSEIPVGTYQPAHCRETSPG